VVMTDGSSNMIKVVEEKVRIKGHGTTHVYSVSNAAEVRSIDIALSSEKKLEAASSAENSDSREKEVKRETKKRTATIQYSVGTFRAENLPFPDNSFDTVVDVFGLCSYIDPSIAMREMIRVCKPDGRILLIEHGKGRKGKINGYLDKWSTRHAMKWGCWWNRDIRRYVRLSGARILQQKEKHFGTTLQYVLAPGKPLGQVK